MPLRRKLSYSIRVAVHCSPAKVARQLQGLLTRERLGALTAFAATHMRGRGEPPAPTAVLPPGAQGRDAGVRFLDFLKTAATATDAHTLVEAGHKLSDAGTALVASGATLLTDIGRHGFPCHARG